MEKNTEAVHVKTYSKKQQAKYSDKSKNKQELYSGKNKKNKWDDNE
jgi:hypothetical protein